MSIEETDRVAKKMSNSRAVAVLLKTSSSNGQDHKLDKWIETIMNKAIMQGFQKVGSWIGLSQSIEETKIWYPSIIANYITWNIRLSFGLNIITNENLVTQAFDQNILSLIISLHYEQLCKKINFKGKWYIVTLWSSRKPFPLYQRVSFRKEW